MRFPRNTHFDSEFAKIAELNWYPYIGEHFGTAQQRIMVYAHNIPISPEIIEAKKQEWRSKSTWADAVDEYTYRKADYTEAFRYFIKAAVGLRENYDLNSNTLVTSKVDDFVRKIAYLNFIQDLVESKKQIVNAASHQIAMSQRINKQILKILQITHCICWGKQVYQHLLRIEGFRVLVDDSFPQRGFGRGLIETDEGKKISVLKIYHPSMPRFRYRSPETQRIISEFIE